MTVWEAGMSVTADRLNAPWQTYAVEWTASSSNPSIGTGELTGKYRYLGSDVVQIKIRLVPDASTTFGVGQYRFSLPVSAPMGADPLISAVALMGSALYSFVGWQNTLSAPATYLNMYRANPTATENLASWSNTSPAALAAGHIVTLFGSYAVAL